MPVRKKSFRAICLAIIMLFLLTSCARIPKPVEPVKPGKEVETLQSFVSLSFRNSGGSMGGNGYLIFKRPDRFHLVVLSPFGFTLMEIFVSGERITCLVPSKETAYTGSFSDLPGDSALKGWSMMQWVIENQPDPGTASGGKLERTGTSGGREFLFFDERGLLQRKTNDGGDQILYGSYRQINGVAFPATIEMRNRLGDTVKIAFDEPEINLPVDEAALAATLDGITILPITDFKGL